jgi:NTE family protein
MAGLSRLINRFNVVKQIPIFSKLNWLELHHIARKSVIAEFKKGDCIAKEGDPPDNFYCLVSGRLQAYTLTASAKKENLEFIHRGMHFGVLSSLTGENHSHTFEAINDSVVLKIPREDFQGILNSIPHLAIELSQSLSKRVREQVKGNKNAFESSIISVYSPVEGTGSSTYALNLAINLQKETKKKVIFVSIHDRPSHVISHPGFPKWKKPAVVLPDIFGDHEKILDSIHKGSLPVDLLNITLLSNDRHSANLSPSDLAQEISPFVSSLVGSYNYVIVDLPNNMDDTVFETLTQSDLVHLVTTDRKKDLELVRNDIDRLQNGLKGHFRQERIKVIVRSIHDKVYLSFEEINSLIDYNVYNLLPNIDSDEIEGIHETDIIDFEKLNPHCPYIKAVTRIARQVGGVMVGLVLGGGAALGVAHVGVIRVLEKEDIPVDIVVGSSMGALIGALWVTGRNADQLELVAREFEKKVAMLIKLYDIPNPVKGLIKGWRIKVWLRKHLGSRTFHSTKIPLKIVSYDLIRREELILDNGSLVDAVRESIAIPGVMEPVQRFGRVIIDGGVLNPLPTNVLADLGIKKIIAVNVLQSPDDTFQSQEMYDHELKKKMDVPFAKAPFHYVGFRIGRFFSRVFNPNIADIIVRTLQASEYVIAEQSAKLADVVIHPNLIGINWFELYRVDELIKSGEDAARKNLPEIKKLMQD